MISLDPPVRLDEKPPEYATVVDIPPPSYDDAIKLDPQRLMMTADCGHRTAVDTCTITVPDECDKSSSNGSGGAVVVVADATTANTVATTQQPSTTLAQAIRKSIRDIRKQLTNTVSDVADNEQQQQPQQQSSSEHNATVVVAPALKSNAQTSNTTTN